MTRNQYKNAPCNPLIINNTADPDNRYTITCNVCGYRYDQYTDDWRVALHLKATHTRRT